LDPDASKVCTIILSWGQYTHKSKKWKQQILLDNQIVKELMESQKMYELTWMTSSASLEAVLRTK